MKNRNKIIHIIVTVAACICVIILMVQSVYSIKYKEVKATVESMETNGKDRVGNSRAIPTHYVTYSYTYNKHTYHVKQQVSSEHGFEKGQQKTIQIDPEFCKYAFVNVIKSE